MTNTQQNPFLTNNVYLACGQARVLYLDALVRMQMYGGASKNALETSQQKHREHLDQYRSEALHAATVGNISSASTQLAFIVTEWGLYKAFTDLIDTYGTYLNAADPDTVSDFVLAVQHNVVFWATELQNTWTEGDTRRKTDQAGLNMQRQTELQTGYRQMFQDQGTMLSQEHQRNQHYADAALHGAQQAAQGVQWMMKGVEQVNQQNLQNAERMNQQAQQGVQWMVQGANDLHRQAAQNIHNYQEGVQSMYIYGTQIVSEALETQAAATQNVLQNLPREMEKAQREKEKHATRRGCLTKGGCAVILVIAFPAAILFTYILLTHFVLR